MSLTGIILAGGKGSRLEPWHAPKCLMPVAGIPIIHRITEHLKPCVDRTIICVGYKADDVRRSFAVCGERVEFSDAGEDAPMMHRVMQARQEYKINGRVLLCYGDELADVDVPKLVEWHEKRNAMMTCTAWRHTVPFHVFENEVGYLVEKHLLVNIGFAVVENDAFAYAYQARMDLPTFYDALYNNGETTEYFVHGGKRATINNPSDIAHAEALWQ